MAILTGRLTMDGSGGQPMFDLSFRLMKNHVSMRMVKNQYGTALETKRPLLHKPCQVLVPGTLVNK